jgi:hypothetical protein
MLTVLFLSKDTRRSEIIADPTYLKTLNSFLISPSNAPETTMLADITIKVLFNLCTDHSKSIYSSR